MENKDIIFTDWLNGRGRFDPMVLPTEYKHIEILSDNYIDGQYLFYAWYDDKNCGALYLGNVKQ